ncbi:hypothetical protein ACF1AE_04825 [Streptomyces sp. NPDC014986]|uniref:hypothetical protein n=1 Tax=Streptomyces sp. NPDC014986 TaxID=3364934 RepID=UPI0037024776
MESLGAEGSGALRLHDGKRDDTHASVHGATVCANPVREELARPRPVPEGESGWDEPLGRSDRNRGAPGPAQRP